MSSVDMLSAKSTSDVNITSDDPTWTDIATIDKSAFTTGDKQYLILVYAVALYQNSEDYTLRVEDGAGSELSKQKQVWQGRASDDCQNLSFAFLYTQPSTPTDVVLQGARSTGTGTLVVKGSAIWAFPVADFAAAHYVSNEDNDVGAETDISTTEASFATIALTTNATDKFLAIGHITYNVKIGERFLNFELSVTSTTLGEETVAAKVNGDDTTEVKSGTMLWVSDGGLFAESTTLTIKASAESGTTDWSHIFSGVYFLNLSQLFNSVTVAKTAANTANIGGSTDWTTFTEAQSLSHTPSIEEKQFVMGYVGNDVQVHTSSTGMRFQEDGADIVTGMEDAVQGQQSQAIDDIYPLINLADKSMADEAQAIDMDVANRRVANSVQVKDRMLIAFSLEAKAAGGIEVLRRRMEGY